MARREREAVLLFTPDPEWTGMHPGAWRLDSSPTGGATDFDLARRLVQQAERAKFHGFFLADPIGFRLEVADRNQARAGTAAVWDPFVLMSALAVCTDRIGLLMTAGTTYDEPYHVARRFASLDRLSGGRAGWNVVTTGNPTVARHFGDAAHMEHDARYERGAEFVDAVKALWDTYEDDAFVFDKASGNLFDPDKMHVGRISGDHVTVSGPLSMARPVQGYPVIAQAGSSPKGRAFAARFAEVMFTLQPTAAAGRAFRSEMRNAAVDAGRGPDDIKILPALTLVVGRTDAEAAERFEELDSLVDAELGVEMLSRLIDLDLTGLDLDGPLPDVPETVLGTKTVQAFFVGKAHDEGLTIRQLISFMLRWGAVGGSPETIADYITEWITTEAADGFNVTFADMSDSMDRFVELVIPELQRRGVFHTDYRGATLRENLGLTRPANQFAADLVGRI